MMLMLGPRGNPQLTGAHLNGIGNTNRSGVATLVLQFDQAVTVGSVTSLRIFNHTTGLPVDISSATLTNNGTTEVDLEPLGYPLPRRLLHRRTAASARAVNELAGKTAGSHAYVSVPCSGR